MWGIPPAEPSDFGSDIFKQTPPVGKCVHWLARYAGLKAVFRRKSAVLNSVRPKQAFLKSYEILYLHTKIYGEWRKTSDVFGIPVFWIERICRQRKNLKSSLPGKAQNIKEPGRTVFSEMLWIGFAGEPRNFSLAPGQISSCNSIDGGRIIYLLDTGKIKDLKFPTFWFDNTPPRKIHAEHRLWPEQILCGQFDENIKRWGHRQKLRKGIWPGFAPARLPQQLADKGIDVDWKNRRW